MKKIINTSIMAIGLLHADAQEADMARLKKLNAAFIHNFVTNDTAAHSLIIHKILFIFPVTVNIPAEKNTWRIGQTVLMALFTGTTGMKTSKFSVTRRLYIRRTNA